MIKNNEEEQHIVKEAIKFMPINEQYAEDLNLHLLKKIVLNVTVR